MQINSKQLTSKNNWLQLQVTVKGNWLLFHLLLNCVIVTVGRFLLVGGKNVFSMDKNRGGKNSFAGKNRFCHINCGPICQNIGKKSKTRMWDNAQPDGRPAEQRWRPLFNTPKFG